MSEIARKRAYVRRGCPKRTTKAIDRAFCRTRLSVTPTLIDVLCMIYERPRPPACMSARALLMRARLYRLSILSLRAVDHATLVHAF